MRDPATDAGTKFTVKYKQWADGNYITFFTPEEVQVFDAEAAPFKAEGKIVMQGWHHNGTTSTQKPH